MNFVTLEFAAFFAVVLLGTWLVPKGKPYAWFLLGCNLLFYASAGLAFLPLLFVVAIINYATAKGMSHYPRRRMIISISIALQIGLLTFYKYYEILAIQLGLWTNLQLPLGDLLFPVGLSFYVFQGLSYSIDAYRNSDAKPQPLLEVLLFVSFFPTLLAGPILRQSQFFPQLGLRDISHTDIQEGFALIISGLFKKVVLASYLSEHIVRDVYQDPELYASTTVIIAVYAYSIQIFCDFSGYTDLALGVGRLMGYKLPQNFNAPYLATNLQDFWRRWHITLSLWLRDYLYIPLGGNKQGSVYLNLIITMGLGGLWHGSHLRFFIWGILHGLGLCLTHLWKQIPLQATQASSFLGLHGLQSLVRLLGWVFTFNFVALAWIFFRAEDLERCQLILQRCFNWSYTGEGFPILVIPAIVCGIIIQWLGPKLFKGFIALQQELPLICQALLIALLAGFILKMGPDGVMPFIYFQF